MLSDGIPSICPSNQLQVYLYPAGICGGGACDECIRLVVWTRIHSFSHLALTIMLPTTTPFPVTMDYSQWYWDPSTFTWLPSAPPSSPYYSDPVFSYNTSTPTTTYSYPTETTDYTLDPYSCMNQCSYDSYLNYYSPNYIPGYAPPNTPNYFQPMQSPAPAPHLAPATCAPPSPATPPPAVPRKCSNCGTTESCKWKNVKSKDNIQCNTCFIYRRRNNKDRPAAAIKFNEEIKMKRI